MKLALKHHWLFARIELGLSKSEFNALSPADFRVAMKLWERQEKRERKRQDELVARLAYFINLSVVARKPTDELPKVTDFMPARKRPQLSPAQLLKKTKQLLGD